MKPSSPGECGSAGHGWESPQCVLRDTATRASCRQPNTSLSCAMQATKTLPHSIIRLPVGGPDALRARSGWPHHRSLLVWLLHLQQCDGGCSPCSAEAFRGVHALAAAALYPYHYTLHHAPLPHIPTLLNTSTSMLGHSTPAVWRQGQGSMAGFLQRASECAWSAS